MWVHINLIKKKLSDLFLRVIVRVTILIYISDEHIEIFFLFYFVILNISVSSNILLPNTHIITYI